MLLGGTSQHGIRAGGVKRPGDRDQRRMAAGFVSRSRVARGARTPICSYLREIIRISAAKDERESFDSHYAE